MKFSYPAEKFSVARSNLMLPHSNGEASSIAHAFHECSLGLHELDRDELEEVAADWVRKLEELMDTTGIADPDERGTFAVRAEQLSVDQKIELSRIIDELAHWFERENRDEF